MSLACPCALSTCTCKFIASVNINKTLSKHFQWKTLSKIIQKAIGFEDYSDCLSLIIFLAFCRTFENILTAIIHQTWAICHCILNPAYSPVVVSASEAAYWCRKWTASVVANLYYYPRTLTRLWRVSFSYESRLASIFQWETNQKDVGKSSFFLKAILRYMQQ